MKTIALWLAVALLLAGVGTAARGQPRVEQRATEEIMPGIFVRSTSGNVVIDVGSPPCGLLCGVESCVSVCRERECDPGADRLARCLACTWECRE
jgi:hypothetical protein